MPIQLDDAKVAVLRSYDLFTIRQGAADYHKMAAENGGAEQSSAWWPLWVQTQNLMCVLDALPCPQIEPQADWTIFGFSKTLER